MNQSRPPEGAPRGRCGPALRRAPARIGVALALGGLAAALGGCAPRDRAVAISEPPADYHLRHPVALADAPRTLDIFVGGSEHLDRRQREDLEAFAAEFRDHGQGRIRALVPRGAVRSRDVDDTLTAVRRGLAAAGVTGAIEVGSYAADDPRLASVLHLSFLTLQAVATRSCGEWPEDLGPGDPAFDLSNRSYYNLGCANQVTLAAQTDDPRDLVRPRAEQPGDVVIRTRSIRDLRGSPDATKGQDPSTAWTQANITPIGK